MNTKTARKFCVKLYCCLPSLLEGVIKPDFNLYMDCRDDVHELVESIGSGVQYLGSIGTTTTWNVDQDVMTELLCKIQHFNSPENDLPCIIHMELY
jgi:hypothetical protein